MPVAGSGVQVAIRAVSRVVGALHPGPRAGLRVLLYHAVGSHVPHDTYGMSVTRQAFTDQMRWLREESGFEIVPLHDGVEALTHGPTRATAVAVTFDDGFRDVVTHAAPVLERHAIPFTVFVAGGYLAEPPVPGLYLDRAALRELSAVPAASIGAHGYSHRPMTRFTTPALDEDLQKSRAALVEIGVKDARSMSYPYGAADARVAARAAAAGFAVGATSLIGINDGSTPLLRLRRTEVLASDTLADYAAKVRGSYDWYRFRQQAYWPVPTA
jgi:peptidoglycan/xylan/chitin deacetylase (PgdA/CDA1 family)